MDRSSYVSGDENLCVQYERKNGAKVNCSSWKTKRDKLTSIFAFAERAFRTNERNLNLRTDGWRLLPFHWWTEYVSMMCWCLSQVLQPRAVPANSRRHCRVQTIELPPVHGKSFFLWTDMGKDVQLCVRLFRPRGGAGTALWSPGRHRTAGPPQLGPLASPWGDQPRGGSSIILSLMVSRDGWGRARPLR